ncbi:MAG: hypothetical protein COV74_04620 [Candidatus Omnitrophica bacterium CG11_big_fil_rev_8_21_14_0_20_45_26]|uniref:Prephenate/arogenate dehydrogenase domain-containing protein n=1 Tax=Candidatus Abzuiibacterium crystallinum TaxID=1974748 RepID=A0A2H0LPU5_9BACT|nr:MAG: hypothetical protein COV74_04620 [Candidatus Omnitrophica bacterium CG11_big_fil_rev_8_21_14_0_20_45_26]PIW64046.1 MAG: hypothetical protein COW12_07745 [Candidatus Omnitrophica bacterium CG12_big_fil_rev_8_21_14_0_65_45_16]
MRSQTFVIVGLGLLGGSLGGALREKFPKARIIGVSRSKIKIRLARHKKCITSGFTSFQPALKKADMVFVCTPVDTIIPLLKKIDQYAKPGTPVTDVGSTKSQILRSVQKRGAFKHIHFIGSHPMAGSHLTGISHADSHLYDHSFVFVTKHPKMNSKAFRQVIALWKRICGRVIILTPEQHDKIVSEISHLPHVIASLLAEIASSTSLKYASTGFRDTTRVAQGDSALWLPILMTNRNNLVRLLSRFRKRVQALEDYLRRGNTGRLSAFLKKAVKKRQKIALK